MDPVAGWLRVDRGPWSIAVNLGGATACVPCRAGRVVLGSAPGVPGVVADAGLELVAEAVAVVDTRP